MKRAFLVVALFVLFFGVNRVHAQWTEPTLAPPAGNVLAPLRNPIDQTLNINNLVTDKKIQFNRTGGNTFSMEHDATRMYFYNMTTATPLLTMQNAGNVGIGIAVPTSRLHVYSGSANQTLANFACLAGGFCQIIVSDGTRTADMGVSGSSVYMGSNSATDLQIRTGATTRMVVQNSTGNVGINTVSPSARLQVGTSISTTGTQTTRIVTPAGGTGTVVDALHIDTGNSGTYDQGVAISLGLKSSVYNDYTSRIVHFGNSATTRASKLQLQTHSATDGVWNTGIMMDNIGNVGVGNAAPAYRLDVTGDVNVPTGNCYRINGVCIGSGGLTGSGTVNTLSMFTAASTLGNSNMAQQADGSVRVTNAFGYADFGPKNASYNHIYTDRPATIFNTPVYAGTSPGGSVFSSYGATNDLQLATDGLVRATILRTNGNVGIGTAAPTQRLTVAGNINKLGSWIASDLNWAAGNLEIHNNLWDGISNNNYGGVIGGKLYAYRGLQSGGATGAEATDGQLYVAGNSMLMGNVGIGITNPVGAVDIRNTEASITMTDTDSAWSVTKQRIRLGAYGNLYVEPLNDDYTPALGAATDGSPSFGRLGTFSVGTDSVSSSMGLLNASINTTYPRVTSYEAAIYGEYTNTSQPGLYAIKGINTTTGGKGVYGNGDIAVYGQGTEAANSVGVQGGSTNGYGVSGSSLYGWGIYCNSQGTARCGGNRAWTNASDLRLKKNIETISSGLDKVLKLRGVNYEWKSDESGKKNVGFIAQEVLEVVPEVVSKNADGYYSINESSINAVLVEAIKELKAENDDLKARLERIEAKIK